MDFIYKLRYQRLRKRYDEQAALLREYVSREKELNDENARLARMILETEQAKNEFTKMIDELKAKQTEYTAALKEIRAVKKDIFKAVAKGR